MPRTSPYRSLTIAEVTATFDSALCRQTDPELWFADYVNQYRQHETVGAAKAVCSRCPHRRECLEVALTDPDLYGVWGGLTRPERRDLTRTRSAQ